MPVAAPVTVDDTLAVFVAVCVWDIVCEGEPVLEGVPEPVAEGVAVIETVVVAVAVDVMLRVIVPDMEAV